MSRIYNEKITIDSHAVQEFFSKRVDKENPLNSIMLQNRGSIPKKRDENERRRIVPKLDLNPLSTKVLDIGCGVGRFAQALDGGIFAYQGVDFVEEYVEVANEMFSNRPRFQFSVQSATNLHTDKFGITPPFDLLIVTALLLYLNDDELKGLLRRMQEFAKPIAQIYIRESVSMMDARLTLKDFPSEELGVSYNAIYRTPDEYLHYFEECLFPFGFELKESDLLLTKELGARDETNQKYFLFERDNSL